MFGLLSIFSMFLTCKEIIKEATEKPTPKGTHFDWDAYWEDVRNCIDPMEQVRKRERGEYMTTKPKPTPSDAELLVDIERYENDKKFYGEEWAEKMKQLGHYKEKKFFLKFNC